MVQRRHDQQVMGCKVIRKLRTGKGPLMGLAQWQIDHGDLRVLMSETSCSRQAARKAGWTRRQFKVKTMGMEDAAPQTLHI